jgi:hypothetical protein
MSKKKNTLKDLDEFLKQQAATLVSPSRLRDKTTVEVQPDPVPQAESVSPGSLDQVLRDLLNLAEKEGKDFRVVMYDFIIKSMEDQAQYLPEDRMLINTALYLKSGEQWKETIRAYWRNKNKV